VKIWNTATWGVERALEGHVGRIGCLVRSSDGRRLGVGDGAATLRVWRVKEDLRVQSEGPLELTHFEVQLPSGSTINVMLPEGSIVDAVKEAIAAQENAYPAGSQRLVYNGTVLQSHRRLSEYGLAGIGETLEVQTQQANPASREDLLEDVACEQCLALPHGRNAKMAAFVAGGRLVVSVRGSTELTVWDVTVGTLTGVLQGHQGEVKALAELAPGLLVSAGAEGQLRLWDMQTEGRTTPTGHSSHHCVKILPADMRRVVVVPASGCAVAAGYRSPDLALWPLGELCLSVDPMQAVQELPEVFQLHSDEERSDSEPASPEDAAEAVSGIELEGRIALQPPDFAMQ